MISRNCVVLCFIAGISIASGSWYDEEEWGLKYPERKTFLCPFDRPITSIYSQFNVNTSQREWKFSCDWNGITNLSSTTSWSERVNQFQEHFSFHCSQLGGSHYIFGINLLYDSQFSDARWRFGCAKVQPGYRLANCTTIPDSSSIGKLQQVFEYAATDNTTFVTGLASHFDAGLKDRMWGLTYCKLAIVQCEKPPESEGVEVTYDSLQHGSSIKYQCQPNYTYSPEQNGICDDSGAWTISPPTCLRCAEIPYCQNIVCASFNLNITLCMECQNFTQDGLALTRNAEFKCEAKPEITNLLPRLIAFDIHDVLTLNCNASGYPKPKIVWLHNSTVVSETERVLLLSNGSLVISKAIPSDVGRYKCIAVSNGHNVSFSVMLQQKKLEPPIIVNWTNTLYFPLKQSAAIHCTAIGHPQPHILWFKDGHQLEHKKRTKILKNGTLFIQKVHKKDSGRYRCMADNGISWIVREALVHVYRKVDTEIDPDEEFAPIIKPWKVLVVGYLNDQIVLSCNSSGNPKPTIKWMKVNPYGNRAVEPNDRISIHSNKSVVVISDVQYSDKGQYICRANNSQGAVEKHLFITVKSTSTPTTVIVTTQTIPTTEETVSSSTSSATLPTSETSTVPTNSTILVQDPPHSLPSDSSYAPTLRIHWLFVCMFSAYAILSKL